MSSSIRLDQPVSRMNKPPRALRADGEATYNRILMAAGELIAGAGFAETSNKAIATLAEVDLASINYHFGSRKGLYDAVLAHAHRRLIDIDDMQHILAGDFTAQDKLRRIIEELVDGATSNQGWHIRVLSRELLSPSSHLQALLQREIPPKAQILLAVLSEITAIPIGDPALLRCLVSVAGPCAMLLVVGREALPFADQIVEMPREDLIEHLYSFAIGGLAAIRRDHAKPRGPSS